MLAKREVPKHCEECPSKGKGIFCELESAALDEVSEHKVTNVFKKGQTLFIEGNPPYGLYCVSRGNIKLSKMSEDGKDSIVRLAGAGDVAGSGTGIFMPLHWNPFWCKVSIFRPAPTIAIHSIPASAA